ncbi:MAG: MBL fold metallo-hydrolase RNA specificity domain-containing protein, partial [Bacteroidia bacterium]
SAHADRNELLDFLKCQDPAKVKHVYLVHGETEAQNEFSKYLVETGFRSVSAPEFGDKVEL